MVVEQVRRPTSSSKRRVISDPPRFTAVPAAFNHVATTGTFDVQYQGTGPYRGDVQYQGDVQALGPQPRQPDPSKQPSRSRQQPLRTAYSGYEPSWLQYLYWWRQATTGVALISCTAAIGLYSWTVHTQHHWSEQYAVLGRMKRNELQLQLALQSTGNALRVSAEHSDMVPLGPERLIELPSQSLESVDESASTLSVPGTTFYPVGY